MTTYQEYRVEDPIPATHPMRRTRCSDCGHGEEWHLTGVCESCRYDRNGEPYKHAYSTAHGRF